MRRFARDWEQFLRSVYGDQSRPGRVARPTRRPRLEHLESRLAPAHDTLGTALPISFSGTQIQMSGILSTSNQVDLYSVTLHAGDEIAADIGAAVPDSLRVFDHNGKQLAFQENTGGVDTSLTFDALGAGTYYVGVSSNGNYEYAPKIAGSSHGGSTAGAYELTLNLSSVLVTENTANGGPANVDFATAQAVTENTILQGTYLSGSIGYYQFTANDTGRLTASVTPTDATVPPPRLLLYSAAHHLLIQSDAVNAGVAQ